MTHTEQIAVWGSSDTPDYYGGLVETYALLPDHPTWATIRQTSGNQISFLGGTPTESRFEIFANYREDFVWKQGYLIDSRFGYISVETIREDTRLRLVRIEGNLTTMDKTYIA